MIMRFGGFRRLYLIIFLLSLTAIVVLAGCSSQTTHPSGSPDNTLQPFIVDYNIGDQGPVFRLLTSDGKEKIEVFDGKFTAGTGILESVVYQRQFNRWNQIVMGQEPYKPNDPVRAAGNGQFGILELVNPDIVKVQYETEQKKVDLSISEVGNRRFVAYKQTPGEKMHYQVYAIGSSGKVLWQLLPEGYWISDRLPSNMTDLYGKIFMG